MTIIVPYRRAAVNTVGCTQYNVRFHEDGIGQQNGSSLQVVIDVVHNGEPNPYNWKLRPPPSRISYFMLLNRCSSPNNVTQICE